MKKYATKDLRNICLIGSQGEGMTSVAEALLFNAKVTSRLGSVGEGNTVCDYSEEEIEKKISVHLCVSFFEHNDKKINMIACPGYGDFIGEVYAALNVCDACVFVIGADTGVNPVSENLWEYLEQNKIPTVIFVNKCDKENVNVKNILSDIRERLSPQAVVTSITNATGGALNSVSDVLGQESEWKEALVEMISSCDDVLTEKFIDSKQITPGELNAVLKSALRERKIFPVLCGSALKNTGTKQLADFIAEYCPEPRVLKDDSAFSGLVYKTVNEPGMGHLNFIKIYSGTIAHGGDIYNATKNVRERIGQICFIQGKKKTDTDSAGAGELVALLKLKDTRTNDILGDEKAKAGIQQISFPEPLYKRAIIAKAKGEEEKIGNALSMSVIEDPTLHHYFDSETREIVVSGMGSVQLEIMVKKIKSRYGVEVELHKPRVPYKETLHGKIEVQGKYKKQSGGHGQYGDCWLRLEPLERNKGFEFVNKIVGGAIPKNFIPSVEKGVKDAMEQGIIAGYPVVDMRVTVFDGSYHDVDSSDMAFKIAGAMALRKGFVDCRPGILEPIVNLDVHIPELYMGTVMGDLNSRRGRVLGMDKAGKKQLIKAQVPLSEIFEYPTDLRSMTKGSGRFTMKLSHYEDCPPQIAQPLIELYQKSRAAGELEK
jgi:elongation factor G